jgi:hypothetical protein
MLSTIPARSDDFPAKVLDTVPHRAFEISTVDLPDMIDIEDDVAGS